jgi:thiol-disulfide isomerase/thioredoxin
MKNNNEELKVILSKVAWCGHCTNFLPVFNKSQKLTKNNKYLKDTNVNFEVYDMEEDLEKFKSNNYEDLLPQINGYPTVIVTSLKNGKRVNTEMIDHSTDPQEFINTVGETYNKLVSQSGGYEEELYKQKYLKYKQKYTELKAQIGGELTWEDFLLNMSKWDLDQNSINKWNEAYKKIKKDNSKVINPNIVIQKYLINHNQAKTIQGAMALLNENWWENPANYKAELEEEKNMIEQSKKNIKKICDPSFVSKKTIYNSDDKTKFDKDIKVLIPVNDYESFDILKKQQCTIKHLIDLKYTPYELVKVIGIKFEDLKYLKDKFKDLYEEIGTEIFDQYIHFFDNELITAGFTAEEVKTIRQKIEEKKARDEIARIEKARIEKEARDIKAKEKKAIDEQRDIKKKARAEQREIERKAREEIEAKKKATE